MGALAVGAVGGGVLSPTAEVQSAQVEKIDGKNISVAVTSNPIATNIDTLKKKLVNLEKQRVDLIAQHQKNLDALDAKIDGVKEIINKAKDLGVE